MILSDNETKIDLLNSEPIAKTIVNLITQNPERPITVGVHGDWGAGKSSVLEMIEASLTANEDIVCIRFNGWRFQGFEDAKIALIEGIVSDLISKRSLVTKAGIAVKDIYKRIDWLKLAKKSGGLALTLATGIPTPDMVQTIVSGLHSIANNPKELATKENLETVIGNITSILRPKEDNKSIPEAISEFRKEFDKLLDQAGVKQLIVLVDDLDRCLPETAIETLEAIRLFVFTTRTAFVIAADEGMIEYAVRRHFPEFTDLSGSPNYARNYLEKLIQVPFRIPILGETETRIYVTLLLVGAELGDGDGSFIKLIQVARDRLKKPWESKPLESEIVKNTLGENFPRAQNAMFLSDQIGAILASGTKGNPRQIKRFLNTLLLRQRAAEARGFAELVKLPVLAKLMIAERFLPRLFEQIAEISARSTDGSCPDIETFELILNQDKASLPKNESKPAAKRQSSKEPKKTEVANETDNPLVVEWLNTNDVRAWSKIQPPLTKVDLRPYIFVTQDKKNYFGTGSGLGQLAVLAEKLLGTKFSVQGLVPEVKALVAPQVGQLFDALRGRVAGNSDLTKEPPGIQGLMVLVKAHPHLQGNLLDLLESLPTDKIGTWAVAGWASILPNQKPRLDALISSWAMVTNNPMLRAAASGVQSLTRK